MFIFYEIILLLIVVSCIIKKEIGMYNKVINECENDFCDLNPEKICDNCCKCIETDKNYKIIKITKIIKEES